MSAPPLEEGWVAEPLRAEFPRLGLVSVAFPSPGIGRSPQGVRDQLGLLATRFRGADALALRQRPVPHAYRVFFRHVGLDPDITRIPVEEVAVQRLLHGGFLSRNLLEDALTIALVETGVPVWALDADALDGPLGLRLAAAGERLGDDAESPTLPAGQIVVADAAGPLAPLFGDPVPERAVTRRTATLRLFAVAVAGVPAMSVSEALWSCSETLRAS